MPAGRPTKYNKAHCEKLIECGRQGMTIPEIAAELGVAIQTLYNWKAEHQDFLEAFTYAETLSEAYWARHLRVGLALPPSEFQGAASLKYMAQRFKGWSEKTVNDHNVNVTKIQRTIVDPKHGDA